MQGSNGTSQGEEQHTHPPVCALWGGRALQSSPRCEAGSPSCPCSCCTPHQLPRTLTHLCIKNPSQTQHLCPKPCPFSTHQPRCCSRTYRTSGCTSPGQPEVVCEQLQQNPSRETTGLSAHQPGHLGDAPPGRAMGDVGMLRERPHSTSSFLYFALSLRFTTPNLFPTLLSLKKQGETPAGKRLSGYLSQPSSPQLC